MISTLIGVAVGGFLGFLFGELREFLRNRRIHRKRRVAAYRRLKGIIDPIEWRSPVTAAQISLAELDKLEETLSEYSDVLDDSTLEAWDMKKIIIRGTTEYSHTIDFNLFVTDVMRHCDRFNKGR